MNIRRFRKSYLVKIKKSHCQNSLANAIKGWSWRESNPRPNKQPKGFLHA